MKLQVEQTPFQNIDTAAMRTNTRVVVVEMSPNKFFVSLPRKAAIDLLRLTGTVTMGEQRHHDSDTCHKEKDSNKHKDKITIIADDC